ncbi:response regulator transcription factor [Paenibacillus koleovorans]|uniref:response regulator transcription factor n=1 Tax=Paenibacillus koleovorans TaxID=121608 RepID=UPI000FD878E6|nr:response regulator [Paenibacillus koleovorans]
MIRLVLVDDEPIILRGMSMQLEQLDRKINIVGTAKNGLEGLEKIEIFQPDYAIIDIRMPIMDGIELVKKMNETLIAPNTKCIILSAHSEFEYAQTALRYGAIDFLLKPLDENMLEDLFVRLESKPAPILKHTLGMEIMNKWIHDKDIRQPLVLKMLAYISKNYMKELQLRALSEQFHVSSSYVSILFKRVTNYSFISFVNEFRVEVAKKILADSHYKISEVAYMVGYNNPPYFDRVFRSITNMTPIEYAREQKARR